jgi:hypothetical protein
LAAIPLSYIIPGLIFIKLDPHSLFSREKLPAIALVVFGLVVSISGKKKFSSFSAFSGELLLIAVFKKGALVLIPTLWDPNLDCEYYFIRFLTFLSNKCIVFLSTIK